MSEVRMVSTTGGEKGSKDARFDLIPVGPLTDVARLYGFGAKKYADRNWEKGYDWSLSYAALMRHVTQFWAGEDVDSETQLSHLASVVFHAFAMMEWAKTHPEFDNRPTSPQIEQPDTVDQVAELMAALKKAREVAQDAVQESFQRGAISAGEFLRLMTKVGAA